MKISTILDQIDLGSIALPKFQRGFVWNRDQVRNLMRSLYLKHPVGSLLTWVTETKEAKTRGNSELPPGTIKLLLDGQQRITSVYGIVRGTPPPFFDGNPQTFTGLYFHILDQIFEFYMPIKMKDNPLWIDVTKLMKEGIGNFYNSLHSSSEYQPYLNEIVNQLTALTNIVNTELYIEEVTGQEKTIDIVVDIFNIVNSGGTKLSKGDLALAKICTEWPEARDEMKKRLGRWARAGFRFRLEWLLRVINAIITGEALFSALKDVDKTTFEKGLSQAEKTVDYLINLISSRLGLDHHQVMGSQYAFPIMVRYLIKHGDHLSNAKERDQLLYWYIQTLMWGRYAGSVESTLNRDLQIIEEGPSEINKLINEISQSRGGLRVSPSDFAGWSLGARFYPVLYMLTRIGHAKDWDTGVELSSHLLGSMSSLELHHIFPKAQLKKHGYSLAEINAIANFTFLTKETNLKVSDRLPSDYLPEFVKQHAEVIESHWIPKEQELWKIENYKEFLRVRRELLANALNELLENLIAGTVPEPREMPSVLDREEPAIPGGIASDDELIKIQRCNEWIVEQGLPAGIFQFELTDQKTGEPLAIFDLAWPDGLQEHYSQPAALLIDEPDETLENANRAGYRYFTNVDGLCEYVKKEILAEVPIA